MTLDEQIQFCKNKSENIKLKTEPQTFIDIADSLNELKELRKYKEKMEMQYLDDINNPLEPLKLSSALKSEIFKYEYRKEHKPKEINPLDFTVMYALKHCLEEQLNS